MGFPGGWQLRRREYKSGEIRHSLYGLLSAVESGPKGDERPYPWVVCVWIAGHWSVLSLGASTACATDHAICF
jgi:hypothetical protein